MKTIKVFYSDFKIFPELGKKLQLLIALNRVGIIYIGKCFYEVKGNSDNLVGLYN